MFDFPLEKSCFAGLLQIEGTLKLNGMKIVKIKGEMHINSLNYEYKSFC